MQDRQIFGNRAFKEENWGQMGASLSNLTRKRLGQTHTEGRPCEEIEMAIYTPRREASVEANAANALI